jgi:hypothetical protein
MQNDRDHNPAALFESPIGRQAARLLHSFDVLANQVEAFLNEYPDAMATAVAVRNTVPTGNAVDPLWFAGVPRMCVALGFWLDLVRPFLECCVPPTEPKPRMIPGDVHETRVG